MGVTLQTVTELRTGAVAKPPLLLEVDLSRGLAEAPPSDPVAALRRRHSPLLADVVEGLRRAATDDDVVGAVLLVGPGPASAAHADELGAALAALGRSGTMTVAFAETFGELGPGTVSYALAVHCDEVWLQPSGSVGLTGVTLDVTFLRGLLDKVDAEPMIGQRHQYKSAAETFTRDTMSEPNREMTQRLADSVVEQVRGTLVRRRRLLEPDVVAAMETAPMHADEALSRGLVDHLGYRGELYADLRRRLGRDGALRLQFAHRYAKKRASRPTERALARRQPVVATVPVRGSIVAGHSRPGGLLGPFVGSDTVCAALARLHDDAAVKAVVLRVDSPGGSYVASDAIRGALLALRATGRPVIASMGQLAASGGYFVSMPCDRIVSSASTLTGSIGVLAGKVVVHETLARVGITRETIGSGPQAEMFSTNLRYNDDQWQRLQVWLDAVYDDFTRKAAHDRGMPLAELEPLARGRVWTGADAHERGLVDELGGLEHAIGVACERTGLRRHQVRVRRPHLGLKDRIRPAESTASPAAASVVHEQLSPAGELLRLLYETLGAPRTGVLSLPWDLQVR